MNGHLRIPPRGVSAIVADVRTWGSYGLETGAVLLTSPGDDAVGVVALAGTSGVIRRPGLFVLTHKVIDTLFTYAEDRGLQARAQVHSHRGRAFLSKTDREGNIRLPGFIASVVPRFQAPSDRLEDWGWWTFARGDWEPTACGQVDHDAADATVVTVDAEGIDEH
jgi:proteasome lid subunit RPN8/RPN11